MEKLCNALLFESWAHHHHHTCHALLYRYHWAHIQQHCSSTLLPFIASGPKQMRCIARLVPDLAQLRLERCLCSSLMNLRLFVYFLNFRQQSWSEYKIFHFWFTYSHDHMRLQGFRITSRLWQGKKTNAVRVELCKLRRFGASRPQRPENFLLITLMKKVVAFTRSLPHWQWRWATTNMLTQSHFKQV